MIGAAGPAMAVLASKPSLTILMYHRVLPIDHPDCRIEQPGMWVSDATLRMHVEVLGNYFEWVQLEDWLQRSAAGQPLPDRSLAVTFDDGWRDNLCYAQPILDTARVPYTVFLISGALVGQCQLWSHTCAALLAEAWRTGLELEEPLLLSVATRFKPSNTSDLPSAIDAALRWLKSLPEEVVLASLHRVVDTRSGSASLDEVGSLMTLSDVREMSKSPHVRFGSHTRNHVRLSVGTQAAVMDSEIRTSRLELEQLLGLPVRVFCYPNGEFSSRATELVRESYLGAVTTARGWNHIRTDRTTLRRVGLHEDIADSPRKLLGRVFARCIA
jgi:peptidoglycan/xylan/chitin deacetylase (PgdA/CDA1 family)